MKTLITVSDARSRMDSGERITWLDARSEEALAKDETQIPGSVRMRPDDATAGAQSLPQDVAYVAYCT